MRRVWALLGKDLLQNYRDRLAFLFTFILPVVFTLFFGFLFGGSNTSSLPLAVANLDPEGAAALRIIEMLESSEVVAPRAFEAEEAERAVADNRVAAALLIPEGFSAGMDAGDAPAVTVVRQMESSGGQTAEQAVRQVVSVVAGGRLAALVALRAVIPGAAPASHPTEWATALETAVGIMENPVLTLQVENSGTRIGETPRGFDMSSPGMLVNWVLFGLMGAAITLVLDRKSGVLQRLLTTRVRPWEVVAGKAGAMVALTLIQQVVLIGLGQFAFGVDYLRSPGALVLTMLTISILSASIGLLLASILHSEAAVISATVILAMVLAALGGAWFPLEITGPTFSAIGHISPAAWVLDALRGIIMRGWGIWQVLPRLGAAWGYAALFFGVAVWRFRFD